MICALQQGDINAQLFTSAELALLKFAGKINTSAPAVTRADVETATQAGWTEAQVAEAVHISALFAAFNRITNGFGLPSPYPDSL
jgi:alkylhydroperoxidase family enzyme